MEYARRRSFVFLFLATMTSPSMNIAHGKRLRTTQTSSDYELTGSDMKGKNRAVNGDFARRTMENSLDIIVKVEEELIIPIRYLQLSISTELPSESTSSSPSERPTESWVRMKSLFCHVNYKLITKIDGTPLICVFIVILR